MSILEKQGPESFSQGLSCNEISNVVWLTQTHPLNQTREPDYERKAIKLDE